MCCPVYFGLRQRGGSRGCVGCSSYRRRRGSTRRKEKLDVGGGCCASKDPCRVKEKGGCFHLYHFPSSPRQVYAHVSFCLFSREEVILLSLSLRFLQGMYARVCVHTLQPIGLFLSRVCDVHPNCTRRVLSLSRPLDCMSVERQMYVHLCIGVSGAIFV